MFTSENLPLTDAGAAGRRPAREQAAPPRLGRDHRRRRETERHKARWSENEKALVDPTCRQSVTGVSKTPVQTVHADFPHTAYQVVFNRACATPGY